MSLLSSAEKSGLKATRNALLFGGIISAVTGVLILAWPAKTAMVVALILAIYAIVVGLTYAAFGAFSPGGGGWSRVGHVLLGIVFVIAGVAALLNLGATTTWLALLLAFMIGITWIVEGVVALSTLGFARSKGWTIFFAILSIIAGAVLLFSPMYIALLWWIFGISLVVLGILQAIRSFSFGR